jgi:hypothetical protein
MAINRRQALGLLGGVISSPYVLKSAEAVSIRYFKIGSCSGAGFSDTSDCDTALRVDGLHVAWVDGPPGDSSVAYSRDFQFNGHATSATTQLGRPSGPTDGTNANLVTCQARPNGSGVNFFSAPQIDIEDERDIWSNRFSASSAEIGAPVQVNNGTVPGDYIQRLFSTTLSNGNLAVAYTYFDNASEVDARVRICNPNGAPLFHERIFSDSTSFVFANNLCAGKNALFFGRTIVGSGGNEHRAERLSFGGASLLHPIEIKPPAGQFINGTPSLLPGANGDLYSLFLAGTVGKDNFDLCLQHFDSKGKRGRIVKVGSQETDNFGLIGNSPRCVWTPAGNILAMTDSVEELIIWLFTPVGHLLSKQIFIRHAARQLRLQALRIVGKIFVPLWIEIDSSNRHIWHAEVRRIDGDF